MCNGYVTIDYAENVPDAGTSADTTDDIPYGIWAHTGSFTIEAVVTPYDIMGAGTTNSTQTAVTNRLTSKNISCQVVCSNKCCHTGRYLFGFHS